MANVLKPKRTSTAGKVPTTTDIANAGEIALNMADAKLYFRDGNSTIKELTVTTAQGVPFSGVTGKPTTLSGYGITDAVSSTGNALTATTATNLSGGSAGTIPYQTGAGATSQLAAGTTGYFLKSNGTSAPSWANPAEFIGLTDLSNVAITSPTSGQALTYNGTSWVNSTVSASDSTKMPLAGGTFTGAVSGTTFSATTFTGALSGNATTASSASSVSIHAGNEVNIGGSYAGGGTLYANYNDGGSYSNISFYNGGTSLASITASSFIGSLSGNAATATTATTISGSSGVTAGTYGSATLSPVITVDSTGRVTSATTATISASVPSASQTVIGGAKMYVSGSTLYISTT